MQKRFCSCGHMVFVRYLCDNGKWRPMVLAGRKNGRRENGHVCPACGNLLNIHTLR